MLTNKTKKESTTSIVAKIITWELYFILIGLIIVFNYNDHPQKMAIIKSNHNLEMMCCRKRFLLQTAMWKYNIKRGVEDYSSNQVYLINLDEKVKTLIENDCLSNEQISATGKGLTMHCLKWSKLFRSGKYRLIECSCHNSYLK